jgi:hypothetical protein
MAARAALILLVDFDGRILVHMHDEQATTRPNRWSLPGGPAAPGESPAAAALRYAGEAGVPVLGELEEFWSGYVPGHRVATHAFCGRTSATPADVAAVTDISPAGRLAPATGITTVFLPGAEALNGRSFTLASGYVLSRFLESTQYQRLSPALDQTTRE